MIATAVGELCRRYVDDACAGTLRNLVHETGQILIRVAEAHSASYTTLEKRGRTREIECDHTLVLVPDIDHTVETRFGTFEHKTTKQSIPHRPEFRQRTFDILVGSETRHQCTCLVFIEQSHIGCLRGNKLSGTLSCKFGFAELIHIIVLDISKHENQTAFTAGSQFNVDAVGGYRTPPMGDRRSRTAIKNALRTVETVIKPDKALAVGIETVYIGIDIVERIMIATFLVLRLMINRASIDLHLSCREITLEILHVGRCVPKAPFEQTVQLQFLCDGTTVTYHHTVYLRRRPERNEHQQFDFDTVLASGNTGIAHAVAAFIEIERSHARFPAGIPYRIAILDIKIASAHVHRNSVIAVTGQPPELRILVERVSAGSIADQSEKIFIAEIIDPWIRRGRICDHEFTPGIIKKTVLSIVHIVDFR